MLLIFQGMDAAGKDSAIKAVFEGVNPQGCEVTSFKQPSTEELDHDFMWRSMIALPQRGRIGIFNRSYYEECTGGARASGDSRQGEAAARSWSPRTSGANGSRTSAAVERYLARNGTVILKFFLNVSREEQRERFLDRLEEPAKNWKFSMADIAERALWPRYMAAYQDLIRHTSTRLAPWHVVPADHKWFAPRRDRLDHRQRARRARSAFPEGRQGRAERVRAGPRGAAEGGEGRRWLRGAQGSDRPGLYLSGKSTSALGQPH